MTITPVEYARTAFQDKALRFEFVEFDGTNAGDIVSWMTGDSVNGSGALREDSGDLYLNIQAVTTEGKNPEVPLFTGKTYEVELQMGDVLMVSSVPFWPASRRLVGIYDSSAESGFYEELV